jgi:hypothetical protein
MAIYFFGMCGQRNEHLNRCLQDSKSLYNDSLNYTELQFTLHDLGVDCRLRM